LISPSLIVNFPGPWFFDPLPGALRNPGDKGPIDFLVTLSGFFQFIYKAIMMFNNFAVTGMGIQIKMKINDCKL
jgi:hypothetical protein